MNISLSQLLETAGMAALVVFAAAALAHGQIEREVEVLASGGGTASSSNFAVHATVGQPAGVTMSGSSVQMNAGLWPAVIMSEQEATPRPDAPSDELPDAFRLKAAYPNPFNPSTRISYALPEASDVRLTVYNAVGQRVRTLVDRRQTAGHHEIVFQAVGLPSGIYYYRLRAGAYAEVRAVSLVK